MIDGSGEYPRYQSPYPWRLDADELNSLSGFCIRILRIIDEVSYFIQRIFLPREQQPTFRSGFETVENLTWAAQRYIGYGAKMSRRWENITRTPKGQNKVHHDSHQYGPPVWERCNCKPKVFNSPECDPTFKNSCTISSATGVEMRLTIVCNPCGLWSWRKSEQVPRGPCTTRIHQRRSSSSFRYSSCYFFPSCPYSSLRGSSLSVPKPHT